MAASQTGHRFRDDVPRALVRAAQAPKLAIVETLRRERDTMIRAARLRRFATFWLERRLPALWR
jgi:hypothetical protein